LFHHSIAKQLTIVAKALFNIAQWLALSKKVEDNIENACKGHSAVNNNNNNNNNKRKKQKEHQHVKAFKEYIKEINDFLEVEL